MEPWRGLQTPESETHAGSAPRSPTVKQPLHTGVTGSGAVGKLEFLTSWGWGGYLPALVSCNFVAYRRMELLIASAVLYFGFAAID